MRKISFVFLFIFISVLAQAAPNNFSFNGFLTDTSGTPVTTTAPFNITIMDGVNCVLYTEAFTAVSVVNGDFTLKIGTGTAPTFYGAGGYTRLAQIFNTKNAAITGNSCTVDGTSASTTWNLNINFNGTNMGNVPITAIPFAMISETAESLNGISSAGFVQITNPTWTSIVGGTYNAGTATTANSCTTATTATTATNVSGTVALANGGTGATTQAAAANAILPTQAANAGKFLTTDGTNVSWATSGGGGTVTNVTGTSPISVATGTSTPVISITSGGATGQALRWSGTAWVATKLNYSTDLLNSLSASPWPGATCSAGQAVIWSSVSDSFTCTTISLPTAQLTGTLAVANGGTGTTTGSITGTTALTFAAGGTNQNVNINPTGTGVLLVGAGANQVQASQYKSGNGSAGGPAYTPNADTLTGLFFPTTSVMGFSTAGSERVRIDSSGFVGIGTTAPNTLLTLSTASTSGASTIQVKNTATAGDSSIQLINDTNSNLQMGTTGSANSSFAPNVSSNMSYISANGVSTAGLTINTNTAAPILFKTSGTERVRIDSSGNLGIGTSTPAATLDINGFIKFKKYSTAPTTCTGSLDGSMAMTMGYNTCVCNGSSWISTSDGSSCDWTCVHGSTTFTANNMSWALPSCSKITVKVWGAGGGGHSSAPGGGGGFVSGQINTSSLIGPLAIVIGGGGGGASTGTAGANGGGSGISGQSGGGGGFTGIFNSGTISFSNAVAIAGGGGGAASGGNGGGGGGTSGNGGGGMSMGSGGTQTAGGTGGGGSGTQLAGGVGMSGGAGGGAGYYGGGGGGTMTSMFGGGGGGSGYLYASFNNTNYNTSSGSSAASNVDSTCGGNTGTGGSAGASGTNGCVVISY